MNALIGYSGFVGSTIASQFAFDFLYNSKNIEDIAGQRFDVLVCAGAPGTKWKADLHQKEDFFNLQKLSQDISKCKFNRLVLISTAEVFKKFDGTDEECIPDANDGYGYNRYWLEQSLGTKFDINIVRLPELFGKGLRKNILFDLIHGYRYKYICGESLFQWYNVDNLWEDIEVVLKRNISLVHLVPEPLETAAIIKKCFPGVRIDGATFQKYNGLTRHSDEFGGCGNYIKKSSVVLDEIARYVDSVR